MQTSPKRSHRQLSGMPGFTLFWFGQVISLLGTQMTGFGLTIWAYQKTGSATALALVGFFYVTPLLIMSPIAGALVDRSNRKFMMMISDLASGWATLAVLALFAFDRLEIWHLFIANAFSGAFQAFQWPAFSAAITTMLPKEQYGRANGMMSLAESGAGIVAPLLAGALIGMIGIGGVMVIDAITFIFAISALFLVHVPQPKASQAGEEGRGSLLKESFYGLTYILKRPSLLGLQLVFLSGNFISGIAQVLEAPMILARTASNGLIFGTVNSVGAVGGLIGGLVMSAWGGTRRKVHGVLAGWMLVGLFSLFLMGIGQTVVMWSIAAFIGTFLVPVMNGSNQAIWQSKVAPDVQGRVFSIRRLIAWVTTPLAMLIAGPLADRVMEPSMQSGGLVSSIFGPLFGVGPGAGMGVIISIAGIGVIFVGLAGYAIGLIRDAEILLPDFDSAPPTAAGEPGLAVAPAD